jgi:broad specificity phosphatase PhoE
MRYCLAFYLVFAISCSYNRYFIVRHAEKNMVTKDSAGIMVTNPSLSEAGKVRAYGLRDELKDKHIRYIFSTNTLRTTSTAEPLKELIRVVPIRLYSGSSDSTDAFINRLKTIHKGNVLVVGHSNTVDDIVNKLCGEMKLPGDLKDSEYDNLFIIKRKGKKMIFEQKKYGYPSNPE